MIAVFCECESSNLGDQAIALGVTTYLLNRGYRTRLFTLGGLKHFGDFENLESLREIYKVSHSPALHTARAGAHPSRIPWRLKALLRWLRNQRRMLGIRPLLAECAAVIVGGGAILDDERLHFPISLHCVAKECGHSNLSLHCLGASSEGIFSSIGKKLVARFLGQCRSVATRDRLSIEYLKGICPRDYGLFGDFAFNIEQMSSRPPHPRGDCDAPPRHIFINVSSHAPSRQHLKEAYEATVVSIVAALLTQSEESAITLGTTGVPSDHAVAEALMQRIANKRVKLFQPASLPLLESELASHSVIVSTRLHSAILGLSVGTPAFALNITNKIFNFFETLGLQSYTADLSDEAPEKIAEKIMAIRPASYFESVQIDEILAARESSAAALRATIDSGEAMP